MVEILVTEEKSLYVPKAQSKFIPKSDDENKLVIDEDESFEIPADLKNFIPFQVFEESANEDHSSKFNKIEHFMLKPMLNLMLHTWTLI